MEAPDENTHVSRFGVSEGPYGRIAYALFGDERPCDGDIECIRATPQLLALIEAAKGFGDARNMASYGMHEPLHSTALAFAKSQDHPDAG